MDENIGTGKPNVVKYAWVPNIWNVPGSIPPGNGRRIFFLHLPSAVVVGESSDTRGTGAVKLSVKLLSGLTLMALIAVAVVGLSNPASAAVDGKIYVTNVASGLTTQSPAPEGRTTASTVYGTYPSSTISGPAARDIVADSDHFIVTVVDADENHTTPEVSDGVAGAGHDISGLDAVGKQVTIALTNTDPIIGDVSTVTLTNNANDAAIPNVTVKSIVFAGDGTNPPIITVGLDYGVVVSPADVNYSSSLADTVTVNLKSVVDSGWDGAAADNLGYDLTLTETDRNTGVFEGYVRVFERTDANTHGADGTSSAKGGAATVAVIGGPVSVSYTDVHANNAKRTASINLDTTPPTATIGAPSTGSETQNRLPTFSGNVVDNQSGLDVSTFALYIDQTDDADNSDLVIGSTGDVNTTAAAPTFINAAESVSTTGTSDGAASMAWSHTPSAAIPTGAGANPDHIVDFQVRVADLAGNYGYSDSDTANTVLGRLGNKPHTVKIDVIIPQISSAEAGVGFDADNKTDKANVRDTIKVTFDGNVKASSISASDFKVTLSGNGGVFVPANVTVNGDDVYLDIDSTIPSNNTPTVSLQGTIQDLAGNSTDAGSAIAADKLKPVITVTRSGGTGTGSGAEGSDSLTKTDMVITVSSDEDLNGPPKITIQKIGGAAQLADAVGIAQGGNVWKLTVGNDNSAGNRAVKVVASDTAGNQTTVGDTTTKAYTVDTNVDPTYTLSPADGGETTQSNPFITASFAADQSTLSVVKATLDGADVTSHVVASADKKKFFYQPSTALTNGSHKFEIKVLDAAGNEDTVDTTFTKKSRTDFVIELFAGWNAISIPSNPIDNAIGSVFSNAGVTQVIAYDASTPAQPWRIASKVDGNFSSQTDPGLTSVSTGHGYWVETSDFENQKVALEGPTGPGDARPSLTTIAVGNGWNFVGVTDQSRSQTQSDAGGTTLTRTGSDGLQDNVTQESYFQNQNITRSYTFNTVTSKFQTLDTADLVKIGSGIWAFISPQQNGKLPHIVP